MFDFVLNTPLELLTIFTKNCILNLWQGSEYASACIEFCNSYMKLAKYVKKKHKRMAINMFCLFLEIAVKKFTKIFDFEWQIINWAACSMTPIFMNTYLYVVGNNTSLLFFCYCNLWLHTNTSRLIENDFHKLINWKSYSSLLTSTLAKFFLQ